MHDPFVWATITLAIWGALGPLVRVLYGNELASRSQKRHWTYDNAKQECRELISVMSNTYSVFLKFYAPSSVPGLYGPHDEREMREQEQAHKDSLEVFYRMLFISDEQLKLKTRNRWISAIGIYEKDKDASKFTREFGTLVREVRQIAQTFIT
jgi:hypothetical protein